MIEQRPVIWNKILDVYKYKNLTRDARMEFVNDSVEKTDSVNVKSKFLIFIRSVSVEKTNCVRCATCNN